MNIWHADALRNISWLKYGISTREAGSMKARCAADAAETNTNRRNFCRTMQLPAGLTTAEQIHADRIAIAESRNTPVFFPGADGIISSIPGIQIAVFCADCMPVLLVDIANRAIGAVHAGRVGTELLIIQKAFKMMAMKYRTKPENTLAVIGPSIGPCCYETDLWNASEKQLQDCGVSEIYNDRICTACNNHLFYSYRADNKKTGRMMAVASITERPINAD